MRAAERQSNGELLTLVQGYIAAVLAGRRVVGKYERLAVERHIADLERAEADGESLRFDEEGALYFLEFADDEAFRREGAMPVV